MSLLLNIDTDPPVRAKSLEKMVFIADHAVGMEDFCELVKYVLTNADLVKNDPRLELVEKMRSLIFVEGYNPGGRRMEIVK